MAKKTVKSGSPLLSNGKTLTSSFIEFFCEVSCRIYVKTSDETHSEIICEAGNVYKVLDNDHNRTTIEAFKKQYFITIQ